MNSNIRRIAACTIFASAFLAWASVDAADKVTICHAAGRAGTTQYVTITISRNAAFGQAGHFNEDGTPRAGHEDDYIGACITTEEPSSAPSVTPSVEPSVAPSASPSPSATPSTSPSPTPTSTPSSPASPTPTPSATPASSPVSTPSSSSSLTPSASASTRPQIGLPETDTAATSSVAVETDLLSAVGFVMTLIGGGFTLLVALSMLLIPTNRR